jgi:uncharacterized protein with GYD domain
MALYMTQFSYTPEAWAALVKSPQNRETAVKALAKKMGGRVLNLYYSFGEYDGVVILEAPDETAVMGILLAAVAPGHLKATRTTVLLTMKQAMEAMGKAGSQTYRAPRG